MSQGFWQVVAFDAPMDHELSCEVRVCHLIWFAFTSCATPRNCNGCGVRAHAAHHGIIIFFCWTKALSSHPLFTILEFHAIKNPLDFGMDAAAVWRHLVFADSRLNQRMGWISMQNSCCLSMKKPWWTKSCKNFFSNDGTWCLGLKNPQRFVSISCWWLSLDCMHKHSG